VSRLVGSEMCIRDSDQGVQLGFCFRHGTADAIAVAGVIIFAP
jgi:hypothetical protein